MGGLFKGKTGEILDPVNIFGKRPGGFSLANALDPGGAILKTTTGSSIGRDIADPGKLMRPTKYPEATAQRVRKNKVKTKKRNPLRQYGIAKDNILSTELKDFK